MFLLKMYLSSPLNILQNFNLWLMISLYEVALITNFEKLRRDFLVDLYYINSSLYV